MPRGGVLWGTIFLHVLGTRVLGVEKVPHAHKSDVVNFVRDKVTTEEPESQVSMLEAAAEAHRKAIRQYLGIDNLGEAPTWLDNLLSFTHERSKLLLKGKFKQALKTKTLKVGVMGISTTAGHDCYHNQSYVSVFGRHMQTVLNVAGIKIEANNHGMGGMGPVPNTLCVEAIVGNDVDILVWDYMMMAPRGDCSVEFFTRAAQSMPSKPVVLMWQGGVWLPETGKFNAKNVQPKKSNDKQSCKGKWMVDAYASIGAHSADLARVLHYLAYLGNVKALEKGTDPLFMDPLKGTMPAQNFDEPPFEPFLMGAGASGGSNRRRLARHHPGPMFHRIWGLTWTHAYLGVRHVMTKHHERKT